MSEFSDNKDSKLAELEASLAKLKKSLAKNSSSVKELQKELQTTRLDSEQVGSDLSAAEEQLVESDNTLKAQLEEINSQAREQTRLKVDSIPHIASSHSTNNYRTLMMLRKPSSMMKEPN